MKTIALFAENLGWALKCRYNLWLHGPYGLAKVVEKIPFRFLIKYLRKYGATIGENCRFERGVRIHRPLGSRPFENLVIGNDVYLGHNILIDLTRKVTIKNKVIIASDCNIWTHTSVYEPGASGISVYTEKVGEVTVEEAAIVYSGVIISFGVTIGGFSRIGANSMVNKSIGPNTFAGGVPAVEIKKS